MIIGAPDIESEEGKALFTASLGKQISSIVLAPFERSGASDRSELDDEPDDDVLIFAFVDGTKMIIRDTGQSCCERRYLTTADDLMDFIGADLWGAEIRDVPGIQKDCDDVHDMQFLIVQTSKGSFTVASHNVHNGYYGGISIDVIGDVDAF